MSVTPLERALARKAGIKTGTPDGDEIASQLGQAVDRMLKMEEAKGYVGLLGAITKGGASEQTTAADPFKAIEAVKSMTEIEDARTRRLREEAEAERERADRLEEQRQQWIRGQNEQQNSITMLMFEMIKDSRSREERLQERFEAQMAEMRRHNQELVEKMREKAEKPAERPKTRFEELAEEMLMQNLLHRPSLKEQLNDLKEEASVLGLGQNRSSALEEAKVEEVKLRLKLLEKKQDAEIEIERMKADRGGALAALLPQLGAALQAFAAKNGVPVPTAEEQEGPSLYRYRCTNTDCGKRLRSPVREEEAECPECGNKMQLLG